MPTVSQARPLVQVLDCFRLGQMGVSMPVWSDSHGFVAELPDNIEHFRDSARRLQELRREIGVVSNVVAVGQSVVQPQARWHVVTRTTGESHDDQLEFELLRMAADQNFDDFDPLHHPPSLMSVSMAMEDPYMKIKRHDLDDIRVWGSFIYSFSQRPEEALHALIELIMDFDSEKRIPGLTPEDKIKLPKYGIHQPVSDTWYFDLSPQVPLIANLRVPFGQQPNINIGVLMELARDFVAGVPS